MKPITNISEVKEAGSSERLGAGGYICKYTKVEDVADKNYLYMEYDIAEGNFANYYKSLEESFGFGAEDVSDHTRKRPCLCSKECVPQLQQAIRAICLMAIPMRMKKHLLASMSA